MPLLPSRCVTTSWTFHLGTIRCIGFRPLQDQPPAVGVEPSEATGTRARSGIPLSAHFWGLFPIPVGCMTRRSRRFGRE